MANWLTYRIRVGDDVLVLADEEAQELIKNETERSKKADVQTASFLESTTTNGIIRNGKSDPFGQTAIGGMKVVIDKGDLIIKGNIKNHARLTRTYNVTQENRTEVFLYRFDSVTNEITGLWRDCIIQGDIILSREDKTELPLRSSGYYDILICKITIPAGATEITQDMIGDFRQNEYYCGYAKNLLVEIDETLTKSDAAADAAAVGTAISNLRKETRTRDIITEKRITNLEAGLPAGRWLVDDSVAYVKKVPENALPFASVDMIGGMTYKDGDVLRSAPATEVKSVGVNLLPESRVPSVFTGFATVEVNDILANHIGERITLSFDVRLDELVAEGWSLAIYAYQANGVCIADSFTIKTSTQWQRVSFKTSVKDYGIANPNYNVGYIALYDPNFNTYSIKNMQIVLGDNDLPYTTYRRNTIHIPAAVQALNGYGWGISDKVYNYIDLAKKLLVKWVERVDLGTLAWQLTNTAALITINDMSLKPQWIASTMPSKIKQAAYDGTSPIFYLFFDDGAYTSFDQLIKDLQGVMLYYELATPVITDISTLLPDDNLIGVVGGGTVTPVNKHGYAVPSKITYQLKGEAA